MTMDVRYVAKVLRESPTGKMVPSGKPVIELAADKLEELEGVKADLLVALKTLLLSHNAFFDALVEESGQVADVENHSAVIMARAAVAKAEGGEE